MHKKILKTHLASLVREKMELTRTRSAYKAWARGTNGERRVDGWGTFCALSPIDARRAGLKADIRHHHLALGLLRGRAYREMERTVAEGNAPSARAVYAALATFLPPRSEWARGADGKRLVEANGMPKLNHWLELDGQKFTQESIAAWLAVPVAASVQEAAE